MLIQQDGEINKPFRDKLFFSYIMRDMGLHIRSLKNIPDKVHRDYFVYLLDYGWDEPLGEALEKNFNKMASIAADNRAVVIAGTSEHFQDEVFSWHKINGEDAEELLPAILLTNRHPARFKESYKEDRTLMVENDLKIILIPLKKFCKDTTDVAKLIDKIFRDIRDQKNLENFAVEREMKKGFGRAVADGIVLKPNFYGVGLDFNVLIDFFKKK